MASWVKRLQLKLRTWVCIPRTGTRPWSQCQKSGGRIPRAHWPGDLVKSVSLRFISQLVRDPISRCKVEGTKGRYLNVLWPPPAYLPTHRSIYTPIHYIYIHTYHTHTIIIISESWKFQNQDTHTYKYLAACQEVGNMPTHTHLSTSLHSPKHTKVQLRILASIANWTILVSILYTKHNLIWVSLIKGW